MMTRHPKKQCTELTIAYYRITVLDMTVTRLTEKFQTTIPAEVRRMLDLHKGDSVVFEIQEGRVKLRQAGCTCLLRMD